MAQAVERVVTRQQPITVKVPAVKRSFEAKPLHWRTRGDFRDLIGQEYSRASTPVMPRLVPDAVTDGDAGFSGGSHLEYEVADMNWEALLAVAFPDEKVDIWTKLELDIWDVVELVKAAMEVNGLERFYYMVDPRLKDPLTQALERAEAQDAGPKMPSSTDVLSQESTQIQSPVETAALG